MKDRPGFSSLTLALTAFMNMKYSPRGFFGAPSLPVYLPFLAGVFLAWGAGFSSTTGSGSSTTGGSGYYYTGVYGFFFPPLTFGLGLSSNFASSFEP